MKFESNWLHYLCDFWSCNTQTTINNNTSPQSLQFDWHWWKWIGLDWDYIHATSHLSEVVGTPDLNQLGLNLFTTTRQLYTISTHNYSCRTNSLMKTTKLTTSFPSVSPNQILHISLSLSFFWRSWLNNARFTQQPVGVVLYNSILKASRLIVGVAKKIQCPHFKKETATLRGHWKPLQNGFQFSLYVQNI